MTNKKSIYLYKNYKDYLVWRLNSDSKRVGARKRLAQSIHCQATYVTQVLNENAHFTLEQAQAVNEYLNHDPLEAHFFLLLVQWERAGTKNLKNYFSNQIQEILAKREKLSQHIEKKVELSNDQQLEYYSSWHYSAIHMGVTLSKNSSIEKLADQFGISKERLIQVIHRLIDMGLVVLSDEGGYRLTKNNIFLGKESFNIKKHHTNWRIQAINNLENESSENLNYTAVYSLSYADRSIIKDNIIKLIQNNIKVVENSAEEGVFAFNADFFEVTKK